jgi:hypothetical protein
MGRGIEQARGSLGNGRQEWDVADDDFDHIDALHVAFVDTEGDTVLVDLYGGGEQPVCGSIRFRFPDEEERRTQVTTLRRWASRGTTVTFVRRGSHVSLLDEMAVLRRALS